MDSTCCWMAGFCPGCSDRSGVTRTANSLVDSRWSIVSHFEATGSSFRNTVTNWEADATRAMPRRAAVWNDEDNDGDSRGIDDRRIRYRFPVRLEVACRRIESGFVSNWVIGESLNISSAGLRPWFPGPPQVAGEFHAVLA